MNIWRIEISRLKGIVDPHAKSIFGELYDFGIRSVDDIEYRRIFLISSDASEEQIHQIANELLIDPVIEQAEIGLNVPPKINRQNEPVSIEVHFLPGVMDTVGQSTLEAIRQLGIEVKQVRTARRYIFKGNLTESQQQLIASRILANECIEQVIFGSAGSQTPPEPTGYEFKLREVPIRELGDDELLELSKRADLFLNLQEMQAIQMYYRRLGREATDVEIETIAQTWSEHCVHKTLKSHVEYEGPEGKIEFKNLLKETIVEATEKLNKSWCISVFVDNAGIIEFDEKNAICFKVETHNHPSAIEPYGGASTGIGGVIRDPLGTGLGAKPVANTDVFCFGYPETKLSELSKGMLHPRRVFKGVVSGVRDYGNRMGIPTINGAIWFDNRYMGNPLVYCGNIGIMPKDKCFGSAHSGDLIVLVGGRTGRDGIHGATFSSGELTDRSDTEFSHAVQIGNPVTEKKLVDVILQARDYQGGCLYSAITDCGAGGLSSAVGEMGEELGAEVNLEKVPLKYQGLRYDEIWISEAQERMVLAVPPENWDKLKRIFDAEDVQATAIGTFANHRQLILRYDGNIVGQLDMEFLHHGLPKLRKKAKWSPAKFEEPKIDSGKNDYNDMLVRLLGHPNIASKEWVIRQYDHEVQGGSVIKPLIGSDNRGPSDASVFRPILNSNRGVAVACGLNPNFGQIDPYWMACCCIDEAIRNVVSVGGNPNRCAILDNFCWDSCNTEEKLGTLVRAAIGCKDAALAFGVPFISGKDSLNNEFITETGQRISIPATLLISAISIIDDVDICTTTDLKSAGNAIYMIGQTRDELGGSHYYQLLGFIGNSVPKVQFEQAKKIFDVIYELHCKRLLASCHDCSEGGLAVAIAEMAFAGGLGAEIKLDELAEQSDIERADVLLFSESPSRFIVEVAPKDEKSFCELTKDIPVCKLGNVIAENELNMDLDNKPIIKAKLESLKNAWLNGIKI